MNNSDRNSAQHELVIILRKGNLDDAPAKGGVWKIAYADFMTAMMAFFLVMWLINAANEETKAQVASYFNPVKLTDTSTGKKGLNDASSDSHFDPKSSKDPSSSPAAVSAAEKAAEAKLLQDPYTAIDNVKKRALTDHVPVAEKAIVVVDSVKEPNNGASDKLRDPFDPRSEEEAAAKPQPSSPDAGEATSVSRSKNREAPAAKSQTENQQAISSRELPAEPATKKESEATPNETSVTDQDGKDLPLAAESANQERANRIQQDIVARLAAVAQPLDINLEVKSTDEGILISLTDRREFGMFEIGSAEPRAELVALVESIAKVLKSEPGYVVIRGHTDSRPFRNKNYDNWQLSTDRAHMAHYMLVRGGLDDARVRRVEGYADRDPKLRDRPEAEENRRIEILLGRDPS